MDDNLFQLAFIGYLMLLAVAAGGVNAAIIWRAFRKQR